VSVDTPLRDETFRTRSRVLSSLSWVEQLRVVHMVKLHDARREVFTAMILVIVFTGRDFM